jgi:YggT family protein
MLGNIIVNFVTLFVFVFNVLLVARVLMSYFADGSNRLFALLVSLTEPVMAPVRRVIPQYQSADLTPLATFFLLQAIKFLVTSFVPVV